MKMDIGNYEHIDREPRRRSFPEELREYSEEDETRKADSDKVALLFILQTFFALVLTSALVLASNGYLGDVQGVLPNEQTDDIASQTLSDIYGKYFPDADSVEDALSSILPKFSDNGEDDEESSQPQTSDEEEAHLEEDTETALLSAKEQNKPLPLLPTSSSIELSGELVLPASVTLAPVVTTAKAVPPLANWDISAVSSAFGYRKHPISGKIDFHSGIDIPAASGTAICAVYPGTVAEVGYSDIFGNYIVLEHTTGTRTRYCHCLSIAAAEGSRIRAGETIAFVGSTGVSTGSHLHLDLIVNGLYADPLWLFCSPNA